MNSIITIIRMEFLREFSNRSTLIFFLVLPLVFTATIGGQLSGSSADDATATTDAVILSVVNEDNHLFSSMLLDAIATNDIVTIPTTVLDENSFGLFIPAGFSEELLAGRSATLILYVDSRDSRSVIVQESVAAAQQYGQAVLHNLQAGVDEAEAWGSEVDRIDFYEHLLVQLVDMAQTPRAKTAVAWAGFAEGETPRSITDAEQASAGQMITWVLVTLLGTSAVLVNERISGTLNRLLIMPTASINILTGKLLSRFFMGLIQMALLFVGGAVLFDVGWDKSPLALTLVSLVFALAITGLGLLLATVVQNGLQAGSINTGLAMALAALGGAWWPLEITPPLYQQVVQILPTTWAMQAYTKILLYGSSTSQLLPEITALFIFAGIFFALGAWRFKQTRV